MKKAKERLDAEATYQMTWKQRVENFWFYYKWVVLGCVFGALLMVIFVKDMVGNVKPDYQIGLLTPRYVSEEARMGLETLMTGYAEDINGDGKVVVSLMHYQLGADGTKATDPMAQMAGVTKLSADMQMADSMLYITDELEGFQELYDIFAYNDGEIPPEGAAVDYSRMGVPLTECKAFDAVPTEGIEQGLAGFRLVKRIVSPAMLEKTPELAEKRAASDVLFNKLTAK